MNQDIIYIGVNDTAIDLFEGQYPVPRGISYNSYLIVDEKCAVMDTVDGHMTDEWLKKLDCALNGRGVDYLVVSHMEPDHSGSVAAFLEKYPDAKIVGNDKTFKMLGQFFDRDFSENSAVVKENDTLSLGAHTLRFIMAPMVHWPEVMMTYETSSKLFFSADAFGKFGALGTDEPWDDEARRYYINIVGKYGAQVMALIKKVSSLDIKAICPLHGPVLSKDIGHYVDKYVTWASYAVEDEGVCIAYASLYGNTAKAAVEMAAILEAKGVNTVLFDLARCDVSEAVSTAFRYGRLVLACATYNGELFPFMETYLSHLAGKNYQNRAVALIENGTWAPMAAKRMSAAIEKMKGVRLCEKTVTVRSALKEADRASLCELADELLSK